MFQYMTGCGAAVEERGNVVCKMSSLRSALRVAITCDAWTSRATVSYVTVTAHYVNSEWKLISYVLQLRAMDDSHTGANVRVYQSCGGRVGQ